MHSIIEDGVLVKFDERDLYREDTPFIINKIKKIVPKSVRIRNIRDDMDVFGYLDNVYVVDNDDEFVEDNAVKRRRHCGILDFLNRRDGDSREKLKDFNRNTLKNREEVLVDAWEITLPEGITAIGDGAFFKNSKSSKVKNRIVVKLPNTLREIGSGAFAGCTLYAINLPDNLERIEDAAFIGQVSCEIPSKFPDTLKYIGENAFFGVQASEIELPVDIEYIGSQALPHAGKLKFGDKEYTSKQIDICDLGDYLYIIKYAMSVGKSIPNNKHVLQRIPTSEIENYFKHVKDWREVVSCCMEHHYGDESPDDLSWGLFHQNYISRDQYIGYIFTVCMTLGLFSDEDSYRAKNFIKDVIAKMTPREIHDIYGGLMIRPYDESFANFFISNYHEPIHNDEFDCDVGFLSTINPAGVVVNLLTKAQSEWENVKAKYPNKDVFSHREHGSINNNLTESDIFNVIYGEDYVCKPENEDMKCVVSGYGYSQAQFDMLESIWDEGKKIKREDMVLSTYDDSSDSDIKFKLLDKDDPEGLIIGELTNCCQVVGNNGFACMKYGATKRNSGFIKFTHHGKIIGQSWVWYNPKTGMVCLDNIEIPTKWLKKMKNQDVEDAFADCLKRLSQSIVASMKDNGYDVSIVTVGASCNDYSGLSKFPKIIANRRWLPDDYNGYSDAIQTQFVISGKSMVGENSFENIK